MSLEYAILGFLNYQSMSGYDLKKTFDDSVHHFWYADQSQIYRTLNRLFKQEMVEMDILEQANKPDRKVYTITDKGREALRTWLISKPQVEAPHSAPMIQVFFAGQFKNEVIIQMFQFMNKVMEDLLAQYGKIPEKIESYRSLVRSDREIYFWNATLDLGVRIAKVQREWAMDMIADLENQKVPQEQNAKEDKK
jgi:PadR family transcriptional regulator AphA